MKDLDYKKMYCEILNNSLTYTKYKPVEEYLYKILYHYVGMKSFEADFIKDLIGLFDDIMASKAFDNLDFFIDLIFKLHIPWYEFCATLECLVFKDTHYHNKNYYYDQFREMCHQVNIRFDDEKFGDSKIEEIFRVYRKYHEAIGYNGIIDKEGTNRIIFFEKIVPLIVAHFYLSDYEPKYLDTILSKITNNLQELFAKSALSGVADLDHFASSLGFEGERAFAKYLIDTNVPVHEKVIR